MTICAGVCLYVVGGLLCRLRAPSWRAIREHMRAR